MCSSPLWCYSCWHIGSRLLAGVCRSPSNEYRHFEVSYNEVSVALLLTRHRSLVIHALWYRRNAKQCIHSTLFLLLLYDILQYQTWVRVLDLCQMMTFCQSFMQIGLQMYPVIDTTETEILDTGIATTSSGTPCFQTWLFSAECAVNLM
jgi:hypothetical protein